MIEKIINLKTSQIIERPYTEAEIVEAKIVEAKIIERATQQEEATAAKAALLEKLGITEEEARLLLS